MLCVFTDAVLNYSLQGAQYHDKTLSVPVLVVVWPGDKVRPFGPETNYFSPFKSL